MIISILLLLPIIGICQNESTLICKTVDEFTDETSISAVDNIIMYEDGGDMKSEGMVAAAFLRVGDKSGKLEISTVYLKVLGIEGCVDKDSTLDIIFDNGEKTQLVNWNDFDCKGVNYFSLTNKENLFKSSGIKAIKYTNKRNYDTMIVKENIGDFSSYLKNILLEIDRINNGEVTIPLCKG